MSYLLHIISLNVWNLPRSCLRTISPNVKGLKKFPLIESFLGEFHPSTPHVHIFYGRGLKVLIENLVNQSVLKRTRTFIKIKLDSRYTKRSR